MGYRQVTIAEYFKYLDSSWCKMDTNEVKKTTATFYEPWNQSMHITTFVKHLNKQQEYLKTTGITISDKSKLTFYTEHMQDIRMFKKRDIINQEDRTKANKTWAEAKQYY